MIRSNRSSKKKVGRGREGEGTCRSRTTLVPALSSTGGKMGKKNGEKEFARRKTEKGEKKVIFEMRKSKEKKI